MAAVGDRRRLVSGKRRLVGFAIVAIGLASGVVGWLLFGGPQASGPGHMQGGPLPSSGTTSESVDDRIRRDFINDQAGEIQSLREGDTFAAAGKLIDDASYDLIVRLSRDRFNGQIEEVKINSDSIKVMRGGDSRFPPDAIVVEQTGSKTITYRGRTTGDLVRVENIKFDNKYRMVVSGDRYAIEGQILSEVPAQAPSGGASPSPSSSPSPSPGPLATASQGSLGAGSPSGERGRPMGALLGVEGISGLLVASGLALLVAPRRHQRRARHENVVETPGETTGGVPLGPPVAPPSPVVTPADRKELAGLGWPPVTTPGTLHIQTIGEFRIWTEVDEDLSSNLRQHPIQSFLWLYLLVWAIDRGRAPLDRGVLAEELYPRIDSKTRLKNLRNRLFDLKSRLPSALSKVVRSDATTCRFDIEACWIDVIELVRLADQTKAQDGSLPAGLEATAELALRTTAGEFLSFWDDLAGRITEELDASTEMVRRGRTRVAEARATLAVALAKSWKLGGKGGRALEFLEAALKVHPEREDVARALYAAYIDLGRGEEARRLAKVYRFDG
jgi:DNA-binding SARP family transcriptional activator